ncbi:arabinosyltransferase domain-containing protein [Hoyosella altamirensis]|uniref:Arabinosyltransferase C n=2 Tax=Hoyosella altamirensis TaxID=616997 RepID=A0A839RPL0_9ACTN|nr:arabinosyltransferase C [Hoyosella altamirensis]
MPSSGGSKSDGRLRVARIVALLTGLAGFLLAVATPLLPVHQTTTTISWPQDDQATSIEAPLISYLPVEVSATIPCAVFNDLPDEGGLVAATIPAQSPDSQRFGLQIRATETHAEVLVRNALVASQPLEELANCDQLLVGITKGAVTAEFAGIDVEPQVRDGNQMPYVVGVFTDLEGAAPDGLNVTIEVDSRFTTSPTLLKILAITIGAIATLVSLAALHRLDLTDGRRHRRFLPASWWKLSPLDLIVGAILLGWYFIGANTADDGYILNMARVAGHAGYMANYYRWYGVPEAPFGWFYDVTAALAALSTASPFVRLTTLIASILCWWIISREVIPRLGRRARHTPAVYWTAAAVFLAFWLPYNNGLRPEPVIAVGALLTWISVERAIATGRLLPAAVATIIAAFSLAAGPTGLMAVAALLAGSRPLLAILIKRARQLSPTNKHTPLAWAALTAPLLAAGTAVLFMVFRDQTLAAVSEASRLRTAVGPSLTWYEEMVRYEELFGPASDGSLARRFAVLILFFCITISAAAIIRRGGLPGVPTGPAARILGVTVGSLLFLTLTPTKWTHHFGAFAGVAAAVAALTAIAMGPAILRSARNRLLALSVLMFVVAFAMTGTNRWWHVSNYGVPFDDRPPLFLGRGVANWLLALTLLLLIAAAIFHYLELRKGKFDPPWPVRVITTAPVMIVSSAVVLWQLASMTVGAVSQYPAYSVARANLDAVSGEPCGMARDVLVETDPTAGLLTPIGDVDAVTALDDGENTGFTANGVARDLTPESLEDDGTASTPVAMGESDAEEELTTIDPTGTGTSGPLEAPGINGSIVPLPFGLDPSQVPLLGSYRPGGGRAALTSGWYELPARSDDTPVLVMTIAGRVASVDPFGRNIRGPVVEIEYGTQEGRETDIEVQGSIQPLDIGPIPSWRNLRIPMAAIPEEATAVRVIARDDELAEDQWVALTPPRLPAMSTLGDVVGTESPVLIDWSVGLSFPCQQPFLHRYGVIDMPQYRITGDFELKAGTDIAQGSYGGGPVGVTALVGAPIALPTYLRDDWDRDWGSLLTFEPYDPDAVPAELTLDTTTRSGRWNPGPIR